MTPRLRTALIASLGFAAGLASAAATRQPSPTPRPIVQPLGVSYKGAKFRPVTVTTDGRAERVGEPATSELAHVYLEVSGVPVAMSFAPAD